MTYIKYFLGKNKVVKKPQTLNCYTHTVFLHEDFWPFLTLGRLSGLFLTFIWQKSLKNNKIKFNYHQKLTCMKHLTRKIEGGNKDYSVWKGHWKRPKGQKANFQESHF